MPPARRRGGNTAASRSGQSTLSFGSKSRVTKPSAAPATRSQKAKDLEPVVTSLPEKQSIHSASEPEESRESSTQPEQPHVAELAVRQQAQAEIEQPVSEEDKRASKITERELTNYWKQEEAKMRGPRVHQDDLTTHEKILRHFDLSSQYGPCIGIARLRRWRRANMLNLNPPIEVLAVLLKDSGDAKQRAYIDVLLS
ncbi:putative DNA polymerase delta subunit 4 [Aspergillus saccharolyticus JOP 1030-1]|uniref:DNA polymerase delta subunit 4 n=1 Tax=Aspergillus saccharolyticus JOP 1030-1 TaxID=1450539 RepID=A0A319A4F6_9EURO|nr:DNA polymerase delta subunit 4 [Aspergillus saccharolyticus JOP 1030-1]PYH42322.1 DNA polymerase delta subunit 4 [Aspergillus saccharolyticus JOP 1030-1]